MVGDGVTIKNGVQLWSGVTVEDEAFLGPGAVFTNDASPRAPYPKGPAGWRPTLVRRGRHRRRQRHRPVRADHRPLGHGGGGQRGHRRRPRPRGRGRQPGPPDRLGLPLRPDPARRAWPAPPAAAPTGWPTAVPSRSEVRQPVTAGRQRAWTPSGSGPRSRQAAARDRQGRGEAAAPAHPRRGHRRRGAAAGGAAGRLDPGRPAAVAVVPQPLRHPPGRPQPAGAAQGDRGPGGLQGRHRQLPGGGRPRGGLPRASR